MGLNLETLIGILVILILLILADGVRRMIRERHGRLRMRIDRRFGKGPAADDDSDDDYPNELIGRPRVRSREEQARIDMDGVDEDGDRADPPIMMDTAEAPPEAPTRRAEQQTLFDADNSDDDASAPESPVAGSAKALLEVPGPLGGGLRIFWINLIRREGKSRVVVLEISLLVEGSLASEFLGGRAIEVGDRVAPVAGTDLHQHALEEEGIAVAPHFAGKQAL